MAPPTEEVEEAVVGSMGSETQLEVVGSRRPCHPLEQNWGKTKALEFDQ